MVKQTAGRDALTGFADEFAHLNDDELFGEVWSREDKLSLKMRSILTVTVLVSKGLIDSSFKYHMQTAKKNGVTKGEMGEILTHVAFYAGWPNAWAAFRVALEVYNDDEGKALSEVRVPVVSKDDELAELTVLFNRMLDRMHRYVEQQH